MPAWLQVLGALVLLVTFLGSTAVFLRGSADKGTIETLQHSNEALLQRVSILEGNEARLTARVEGLERENAMLLSQRPSAEVLLEIREGLVGYHDEITAFVGDQRTSNGETHALLMAIATTLGEMHEPK